MSWQGGLHMRFMLRCGQPVAVVSLLAASAARGASEADMVTPPGANATITVTLAVSTTFGTSSDGDTRTMAATGTANAIFTPTATPFTAVEFRSMQLSFSNTTFVF